MTITSSIAAQTLRSLGIEMPDRTMYNEAMRSLPKLERFSVKADDLAKLEKPSGPMGPVPKDWQTPHEYAEFRADGNRINAKFDLYASKSNRSMETILVGREWGPIYPHGFTFPEVPSTDSIRAPIQPAFAGLATTTIGSDTVKALGNVARIYGGVKMEQINEMARTAIRQLAQSDIAPHRFLLRGAALYYAALACEKGNTRLSVLSATLPQQHHLQGIGDLNAMLVTAGAGSIQPIYYEANRQPMMQEDYIAPLMLAGSSDVQWGPNTPAVADLWPQMPETAFYLHGRRQIAVDASTIGLNSASIHAAFTDYAAQISCMGLWEEMLDLAEHFLVRPLHHGTPLAGVTNLSIPLPALNLSATGLGPMASAERDWTTSVVTPSRRRYSAAAWNCWARAGVVELLYLHVLAEMGTPIICESERDDQDDDLAKGITVLTTPKLEGTPVMSMVNKLARTLGWDNALGRWLIRMSPSRPGLRGEAAKFSYRWKYSLQWEEYCHVARAVPDKSAFYGLIKPACSNEVPMARKYMVPSTVQNRLGDSDALYSVFAGGAQIVQFRHDSACQAYTRRRVAPALNYRGAAKDYQFSQFRSSKYSYRYGYQFNSTRTAYEWYLNSQHRQTWDWQLLTAVALSDDDSVLLAFQEEGRGPTPSGGELPADIGMGAVPLMDTAAEEEPEAAEPRAKDSTVVKTQAKGSISVVVNKSSSNAEVKSWVQAVEDALGELPDCVGPAVDLIKGKPHDMSQVQWESQGRYALAQRLLRGMQDMGPRSLLMAVEFESRGNFIRSIASLYYKAVAGVPPGASQDAVIAEAVTLEQMAAQLDVCPAINVDELDLGPEVQMDDAVRERIDEALQLGMSATALLELADLAKINAAIAEQERKIASLGDGLRALTLDGTTSTSEANPLDVASASGQETPKDSGPTTPIAVVSSPPSGSPDCSHNRSSVKLGKTGRTVELEWKGPVSPEEAKQAIMDRVAAIPKMTLLEVGRELNLTIESAEQLKLMATDYLEEIGSQPVDWADIAEPKAEGSGFGGEGPATMSGPSDVPPTAAARAGVTSSAPTQVPFTAPKVPGDNSSDSEGAAVPQP